MDIKEMRKSTNMTQREFANKYHIPVQTLKQWESDPQSSSHRRPPDYVIYLLDRLIHFEHLDNKKDGLCREEALLRAAEQSKDNAKHWFRYLRKEFVDGKIRLTPEQLAVVLNSGRLTMFQRISLLRAIEPGTETNKYILSLNEPAKATMLEKIRRRHRDD
jgi:transcriptional regulator with XRE-family HTH domain